MSTGSGKPNRTGSTPALPKGAPGEDTDLTVALPDRTRVTHARSPAGSQMGTEPPTVLRRTPEASERLSTEDRLAVEPTHVGTPVDPVDPYIGRVMSERYRILKKIGEGGMGTVYLAEHVVIEKKVAIKILSDDLARKGDLVTRFMQEAKAASRIGHENIVDITDFGQTDAGSVFFAMEFLDGGDLASIIREHGPLPFARVRPIVTQICRALGAAHGKGIIHRDMKPENIYLVERDGRTDFVKILDFGIAKMSSMDEAGERLTRTGMIFGTPEYMSPEQARGERPDHRVDIYAVGCILYEMLTGDVPFHAETFMGVLTKHMFETPDPPTRRAPQANIPADVEAVVMRALAKNRDERYLSMRDFSMAIAACAGGDTSQAWGQEGSGQYHPLSGQRPSARSSATPSAEVLPVRRGRKALWLGILGGAALATAIVAWPRKPTDTPVEPAPRVAPLPSLPDPGAVEPVVAKPPAETPPVQHDITIETQPPGAEVFNGVERLGVTNGVFKLDHASKPVILRISKKGFKDYALEVHPDQNRRYKPPLELLPRRPVAAPVVRKPPPPPPLETVAKPAPKPELPKPEQPKVEPPPKKRQARDLMDPFPTSGNN